MLLKVIIALVLLGHGIGHSMGLLQVFRVAAVNPQWHGDSWLLSNAVGSSAVQAVGVVLWSAAIVGFVLLAAVVMGWLPATLWQPLAVFAAGVSLVGLAVFPTAFPLGSTIGALAVNVVLLAAVLWYQWTPADIGA